VEEFLHGPNQTITLTGYAGVFDARKQAQALLSPAARQAYLGTYGHQLCDSKFLTPTSSNSDTYSFTVVAAGTGKSARLVLSKTREWFDCQVRAQAAYGQELKEVCALQQCVPTRGLAPAHEVIVID
jgi:hypothetical protein